jgi:hypothetical protein
MLKTAAELHKKASEHLTHATRHHGLRVASWLRRRGDRLVDFMREYRCDADY